MCDVCGDSHCDGYGTARGQNRDDAEFHRGYRTSHRIAEARKVYGDKVADQMEIEADRALNYY